MSEDDKTDDQRAVEGLLKDWPNPKPGAGSPRRILTAHGNPSISLIEAGGHTLTSVASASARVFGPDESALVDEFLEAVAKFDKKTLLLLDENVMTPQQVGIETDLEQEQTGVLVKAEIGDREIKEQREHELELARIEARGPIWVEGVKWVLLGAGWAAAVIVGLVKIGNGG